jgi:hypothetical protein
MPTAIHLQPSLLGRFRPRRVIGQNDVVIALHESHGSRSSKTDHRSLPSTSKHPFRQRCKTAPRPMQQARRHTLACRNAEDREHEYDLTDRKMSAHECFDQWPGASEQWPRSTLSGRPPLPVFRKSLTKAATITAPKIHAAKTATAKKIPIHPRSISDMPSMHHQSKARDQSVWRVFR